MKTLAKKQTIITILLCCFVIETLYWLVSFITEKAGHTKIWGITGAAVVLIAVIVVSTFYMRRNQIKDYLTH